MSVPAARLCAHTRALAKHRAQGSGLALFTSGREIGLDCAPVTAPSGHARWTRNCAAVLVALLVALPAAAQIPFLTDQRKFTALVFPDRSQRDYFLVVSDFRVNEDLTNNGGDRFFVLRAADGTFQVPFGQAAEVEFTRFVGLIKGTAARYEARVVLPRQAVVRRGTIDIRVMRGFVGQTEWHDLIASRPDRGASLYKIQFVRD